MVMEAHWISSGCFPGKSFITLGKSRAEGKIFQNSEIVVKFIAFILIYLIPFPTPPRNVFEGINKILHFCAIQSLCCYDAFYSER